MNKSIYAVNNALFEISMQSTEQLLGVAVNPSREFLSLALEHRCFHVESSSPMLGNWRLKSIQKCTICGKQLTSNKGEAKKLSCKVSQFKYH